MIGKAKARIAELEGELAAKEAEILSLRLAMSRTTKLQEWDVLRSVPEGERSFSHQMKLERIESELGLVDEPHPHVGMFRVRGGHGFRSNT